MKYTLFLTYFFTVYVFGLGTFKDGLLVNPNTNKPFTGNLEIINNDWGTGLVEFSKDYKDGVLHGFEKTFYKSGKLKSVGKFNNGQLDGYITHYYPNGYRQVEMYYENGVLTGVVKTWYENSNLMREEPYEKGLLHGYVRTYYESGGVFEEVKYDFGTPKIMIRYREDGTIFDQKVFIEHSLVKGIIT